MRARLPTRQTLPGLVSLLDDMGWRIVGHVGGQDIEKGHVIGRLVVGLQLSIQCHALDGCLQRQQTGSLELPPPD